MKTSLLFSASAAAALFVAGCQTVPPGAERGPHGTIAYDVLVEASEPGARIEAEDNPVGNTPVHLKIFGDTDGTFHDFGSDFYIVRALPLTTNQFPQVRMFGTGRWFGPEDRIPQRIYFDMNQPSYPPPGPPAYVYPWPPPYYYYYGGPYFYGRPYYGPGLRLYVRPSPPHRRW